MPPTPLYQNSVRVVTGEVTRVLQSALEECIDSLEINLNLMRDYASFKEDRYNLDKEQLEQDETYQADVSKGMTNECSNQL